MATPADDDKATLEAARWLILIEEEPENRELRARFHAWLAESPANADAWANTADIYDLMQQAVPSLAEPWRPAAGGRQGHAAPRHRQDLRPRRSPAPTAGRRGLTRRWVASMAAIAAAACIGIFLAPEIRLRLEADHLTGTAEQRTVRLADGTIVYLGPESAIEVDLSGTERRIALLTGEAFFEVARDPSRPFHVFVERVDTTVVGTAFEVHRGEQGTAVSVREGHVRVAYSAAAPPVSEQLQAGDWVRIGWSGQVSRGTLAPDAVAPWRRGQIVARDRTLSSVIDDLRRYQPGIIILADANFGRRKVSGVYNVADPLAALRALAAAHGGSVRRFSPWVVVVSGD